MIESISLPRRVTTGIMLMALLLSPPIPASAEDFADAGESGPYEVETRLGVWIDDASALTIPSSTGISELIKMAAWCSGAPTYARMPRRSTG